MSNAAQRAAMRKTVDSVLAAGPCSADRRSFEGRPCPRWYRDGKFGVFIHWGLYAVPAFGNEWYARHMYQPGTREYEHHRATYGPQDKFGYKDFVPLFRAERYDPAAWAALFKRAGARFVVPVAEHHDGFAMYESALNRWNAAAMGPRRDLLGDLADAARREGLAFGVSSHRAEHYWFFDGGLTFDSDVRDPAFGDLYGVDGPPRTAMRGDLQHDWHAFPPPPAVREDWLAHTVELVDKYRPDLVWFDWWINNVGYERVLSDFAAYYYNRAAEWGREVAINYKHQAYAPDQAVFDIERGQLDSIYPLFWQNDTSVSKNSWGYVHNQDYKRVEDLVGDLVDVVSKNGALLLNIGPRPDGTIPEPEIKLLEALGDWLAVHGEAIYDTRPWHVFGEGPTRVAAGSFTDTQRAAFTSADARYTRGADALYAVLLARPADGRVKLRALAEGRNTAPHAIRTVELLGHGPVPFRRDHDALAVDLSPGPGSAMPCVLKIPFADA